jgi:replication-associated recombination protein RarA
MRRVVGHTSQLRNLRANLPPVTLLLGPDGVGKWTLALNVAEHYRYWDDDTFASPEPMGTLRAQSIIEFTQTAGLGPSGKLVLASLDEAAPAAQNTLLKLLEEPPPKVKFLLTASTPPLPTVVSRCQVLRLGLLTDDQVTEVLGLIGHDPRTALAAAAMSGGSVRAALDSIDTAESALEQVRKALRAVSEGTPAMLPPLFRGDSWGYAHHRLLLVWAVEIITGRLRLFSAADTPRLGRKDAQYVIVMASALDASRPKVLDRMVLESIAAKDQK